MIALRSFLVLFIVLILECARRRREHWRYFEKRNIPGPPPHFLWGHYFLLTSNHRYWYEQWSKEYGDTYGVFWGSTPLLVTTDLDLQQRVMVREFSNFINRAPLFAVEMSHPISKRMLINEGVARWKDLRSVITPAFSSANLKAFTGVIQDSAQEFGKKLAKQQSARFDIIPFLGRMTMDIICRTAFGIDANSQSDGAHEIPLLVAAKEFFNLTFNTCVDILMNCFGCFTSILGPVVYYLFKFNILRHATDAMSAEARKIVNFRRKTEKRKDIMQILLDLNIVNSDDNAFVATDSGEVNIKAADSLPTKRKTIKLCDDDVIANSVLMLLAGYETTTTGLAYTSYLLGKHPEIQEKLRCEIIDTISEDEDQDSLYTKVMNLKYLNLCIQESLRLYPPVTTFTSRVATDAIDHGDFKIDAGLSIIFPTHIIQNDPRNFEDPLSFIPDRFNEKPIHPLAYQPFGHGPRNCVGMRMALLAMKLTVCHVLRNFKITTEGELQTEPSFVNSRPKEVIVTVEAINAEL